VITAFNVQHLESLKQIVKRVTGVDVQEAIPDTFLGRADEIVTVDISLRELALREVARDQSRQREVFETLKREGGRRTAVADRIMVCLSSNPDGSDELLRKAARIAARRDADWFAVHVETPDESVQKISTSDFRALLDNINLAADLGAETVWLKSNDVIKTLVDFAREKDITLIVIGRTRPTLWNRIRGGSVSLKMIAAAADFDLEIVGRARKQEEA